MPVVIPLTSLIYTEFPLKHDEREVRGFSSACVSVEILCVCICLGCSSPCCGLTSDSWCLKQEIEESGLHPTVYMPDVPCCFPDTHPPHPISFLLSEWWWVFVSDCSHFLTSFWIAQCFCINKMWVLSYDSSKSSPNLPLYLCRAWTSQSPLLLDAQVCCVPG